MTYTVRWGIIGAGRIARSFATALQLIPEAELVACASQHPQNAQAFAKDFNICKFYNHYNEMVQDDKIDAVYIGIPHPLHYAAAKAALECGKATLCEKPFTLNSSQAEDLINTSRQYGVFLMEAMWTRFIPHYRQAIELVRQGAIGELRQLQAEFGFVARNFPAGRHYALELGGGSLLDVGVYGISFASDLFGAPIKISSVCQFGETGVDEQMGLLFAHPRGAFSQIGCSITTNTKNNAFIYGSQGWIELHSPWWRSGKITLKQGDSEQTFCPDIIGDGYVYQALEVARCLNQNQLESTVMPLDESLQIMQTMDLIRSQCGLVYPQETGG